MPVPAPAEHFTSRRYEVRHRTEYTYEKDVTASFSRAMLRPRETPHQRVLEHDIVIEPEPAVLDEHVDTFGNYSHYVEIRTRLRRLIVRKRTVFEVAMAQVDLERLDCWTVAEAARAIASDPAGDPVENALYLLPSARAGDEPAVVDFSRSLLPPGRPLGQALRAVYHDIYSAFRYAPGTTTVRTTLPEVLDQRTGVCQDFAHLAVAAFRIAGLPARYVSGYIETTPPPGQPKLEGSDASHAWVSVLVPGGTWVDLDPTNDQPADSRYVVTAWGRDFGDVSPLKGVIFGEAGESTLDVGVDVIRLPDEVPDAVAPDEVTS